MTKHLLLLCFLSAALFGQQATISGTVVDRTGAAVSGAHVKLSREAGEPTQEVAVDGNGQFSFTNVVPGIFHISVSAKGFAANEYTATVGAGETATVPQIVLQLARVTTDVQVSERQTELAEEQIKQQEQQRLIGLVPNYRVSYLKQAVPLDAKQKFEISWKTIIDPAAFGITGIIAGVEQANNGYPKFGQGAEGYAKRYGASYATFVTDNLISGAILPALFRQDPRYFVKGDGTKKSRALYAIANSVICKGDNGRWQPKYYEILGNLASGAISNYYYPKENRNGVGLTLQNAGIGIGAGMAANLFQEFVSKKITPKAKH